MDAMIAIGISYMSFNNLMYLMMFEIVKGWYVPYPVEFYSEV